MLSCYLYAKFASLADLFTKEIFNKLLVPVAILQIGQSPYRAGGRRRGMPFGGGGKGHFDPRLDGS